jgi:negative regulator of sigma E activity
VTGEDTIAGRKAWVLALRPRIKKRPFRQLWVDKKSFAILAVRDWSSANRLKRQTTTGPGVLERTRDPISRQPAKPAAFDLQRAVRAAERKLGWKPALPRCVPEGFEPVDIRLLSRGGWVQIAYSDGLYALSVFQRFSSRPGREHKRTIAVYDWGVGLLLSTNRADREVVVVADLAGNELESIGQSIR